MASQDHDVDVTNSVERFTNDFYKQVARQTDGNFISSALSAHLVLAMAAHGAAGNTAAEMKKALHLPEDLSQIQQGFQTLIQGFNTDDQDVFLKVANKIYVSDSIEIKEKFKKIISTYFQSACDTLDFFKNKESANTINQWCIDQTNGMITDIVDPDTLRENTRMILLNAVYFRGNWYHQFTESSTKMKPFHVNKSTTIQVPTMFIKEKFIYEELKEFDAIIVGLPYEGNQFVMLIILPKNVDGLQKLDDFNFDFDRIFNKDKYLTELYLELPKFRVETKVDLIPHLKELGMVDMFSHKKANFDGIANTHMFASNVIQKTFIEVNEKGTEAAAVVAMRCIRACQFLGVKEKLEVKVDKPFIYRIMHLPSKTTLFSGRIVNPIES